jgi:hypothetical protein
VGEKIVTRRVSEASAGSPPTSLTLRVTIELQARRARRPPSASLTLRVMILLAHLFFTAVAITMTNNPYVTSHARTTRARGTRGLLEVSKRSGPKPGRRALSAARLGESARHGAKRP